jgi:DNA helicase-2/ATP-dependent DNA helicase PcrA
MGREWPSFLQRYSLAARYPTKCYFDEAFALLSRKAAAFLLEPKSSSQHQIDVTTLLELVDGAFRSKGQKGSLRMSARCMAYAANCRDEVIPKVNVVKAASDLVASARNRVLTGNPRKDWLSVKQDLRQLGDSIFREMASILDFLPAFARGQPIYENLSALWMEHGNYLSARVALDAALAQDQLLSSRELTHGIHVMNMHKCKGKQFDGVVLYRQQYHSSFVWASEDAPESTSTVKHPTASWLSSKKPRSFGSFLNYFQTEGVRRI